jgi:hypothetical protein
MKQGVLRGFGAAHLTGAVPPQDMPDDVVTLCEKESQAISWSIGYAKARFGYRQIDIARLCGWTTDNQLSAYAHGRADMPAKHYRRFAQVTGCNLLEQWQRRHELTHRMVGRESPNDRAKAVLARMLAVAA